MLPENQSRFIYKPPRAFRNGCTLQTLAYTSIWPTLWKVRFPSGPSRSYASYPNALAAIRNYSPLGV